MGCWYGGRLSQDIHTPRQALLKAGYVSFLFGISCIIQLLLLAVMTSSMDIPVIAAIGVGLLFGVGLDRHFANYPVFDAQI